MLHANEAHAKGRFTAWRIIERGVGKQFIEVLVQGVRAVEHACEGAFYVDTEAPRMSSEVQVRATGWRSIAGDE